jgi:CHAD domain-containing protein
MRTSPMAGSRTPRAEDPERAARQRARPRVLEPSLAAVLHHRLVAVPAQAAAALALAWRTPTPEAVHDARAQLRTLRVLWRLWPGSTPEVEIPHLAALKAILAEMRDLDVATMLLPPRYHLDEQRARALARLRALSVPETRELARVDTPEQWLLLDLGSLVAPFEQALRRARYHPDLEHLHALRRSVRQLRIAAVLLAPLAPTTLPRFVRRAGSLTAHLGHAHDPLVATAFVDDDPALRAELLAQAQRLAQGWLGRARLLRGELDLVVRVLAARSRPSKEACRPRRA